MSSKKLTLYQAVRRRSLKDINKLLRRDKTLVNQRDDDYNQTACHIASSEGFVEVLTLLLDKYKADPNPVDKNGWTPLHSASTNSQIEACTVLLSRGAETMALTNDGATPLHYFVRIRPKTDAEELKVVETIGRMIDAGADVNAQNKYGESPLHQAAQRGTAAVLEYLCNRGSKVNMANKFGETALHCAARYGDVDKARVLLAANADGKIVGDNGTALKVAEDFHYNDMIRLLNEKIYGIIEASLEVRVRKAMAKYFDQPELKLIPEIASDQLGVAGVQPETSNQREARLGEIGKEKLSRAEQRVLAFRQVLSSPVLREPGDEPKSPRTNVAQGYSSVEWLEREKTSMELTHKKMKLATSQARLLKMLGDGREADVKSAPNVRSLCRYCQTFFRDIPVAFHSPHPNVWEMATNQERNEGRVSTDLCKIKNRFFIRGLIEIPIIRDVIEDSQLSASSLPERSTNDLFTWGVWAELPEEQFNKVVNEWKTRGRDKQPSFSGILATALPSYSTTTLGLQLKVTQRKPGLRPVFDVEKSKHDLYTQQKQGIDLAQVFDLLRLLSSQEAN